jgi:hypothetical protein
MVFDVTVQLIEVLVDFISIHCAQPNNGHLLGDRLNLTLSF